MVDLMSLDPSRGLGSQTGRSAGRGNDRDSSTNEVGRLRRQSLVPAFRPAILDRQVLAVYVAGFPQSLAKRGCVESIPLRRCAVEESDCRHCRLLPARSERPRSRAAEQRDELAAAAHSITSSARRRKASGIFSPSTLAVVRLTTRSNLVGCSTGRSAGFAPRRILSTYSAARRKRSGKFGPYDIRPPASTYSRMPDNVGSRAPNATVLIRTRFVFINGSA